MRLDLGSIQSTKDFVRSFKEKNLPLHILINNAAIMGIPFGNNYMHGITRSINSFLSARTDDGHEMHFQV